jgi:hypothetical protein
MVNDGRITHGRPISASTRRASSSVCAIPQRGSSSPQFAIAARKRSRSSALRMTSARAPIISTPKRSSTPESCSARAVFSAVCPPRVGSSASGRSFSMICATTSGVIGSMYVTSAVSGSVMIVAGFELTSTIL